MTELLARPGGPGRPVPLAAGAERARVGRALHALWQAQAGADPACTGAGGAYRAERPVRLALAHAGWEVTLHGRIDGVREARDGARTVEELKTLAAWPPDETGAARARRQAALYAWMLAREEAGLGPPVSAELVWLVVGEAAPRREPVAVEAQAVEAALRADLDAWIRGLERQQAARAARRALVPALRFPHARPRPLQEALTAEVERAVAQGEQLLVEAPTGAGKTAAVLHAALRAALAEDRRLVVLVPTALVGGVWAGALRQVAAAAEAAAPPLGVQLRGKAAVCLQPPPRCHPACCDAARDLPARLEASGRLEDAFRDGAVLDPERARTHGAADRLCPFELLRRAAADAPVWIADWNHAFHPRTALPELRDEAARGDVWIVDEVHRLPDRLRAAGAAALDAGVLGAAVDALAARGAPRHAEQRARLREVAAVVEEAVCEAGLPGGAPDTEVEQALPHDALEGLREALAAAVGAELVAEAGLGPDPESPLLEAAWALDDLLAAAARPGALGLAGRVGGAARLRVVLPDPAVLARAPLARAHAVVGLSATLPPAPFLADLLGLDAARVAAWRGAAPADPARLRLVIDPGVETGLRARRRATAGVAARLAALAEAVPGHTLAVLPGFAWLDAVRAALPAGTRIVRAQRPGDDAAARRALLHALSDGPPSLVLAAAGGVYAEGVDVAPGRLRAVAVVGPCLPPPDAERRAFEALCEERSGEGFLYAYAVPGMTRVVQAAGRLLRGAEDRGVVALLGRRFLREPYRGLLPEAWCAGAPPESFVGDAAAAARAFFASSA